MNMEATMIYLMLFFRPSGRITFPQILFWVILAGLIVTCVITKKKIGENRWRWKILFGTELGALIWANFAAAWGTPLSFDRPIATLSRIGVVLYAILAAISLIAWCCFRKNVRE